MTACYSPAVKQLATVSAIDLFEEAQQVLSNISLPEFGGNEDPEILDEPVDCLKKSLVYPFGLSDRMLEKLHTAGINSVRGLYEAPDDRLDDIEYIGEYRIRLLRNVVAQAIWL
jgi:hypothetical protein